MGASIFNSYKRPRRKQLNPDQIIEGGTTREKALLFARELYEERLGGSSFLESSHIDRINAYLAQNPEELPVFKKYRDIASALLRATYELQQRRNSYRHAVLILQGDLREVEHAKADAQLLTALTQHLEERRIEPSPELLELMRTTGNTYQDIIRVSEKGGEYQATGDYEIELRYDSKVLSQRLSEYALYVRAFQELAKDKDIKDFIPDYAFDCLELYSEKVEYDRFSAASVRGIYFEVREDVEEFVRMCEPEGIDEHTREKLTSLQDERKIQSGTLGKVIARLEKLTIKPEETERASLLLKAIKAGYKSIEDREKRVYFPDREKALDEVPKEEIKDIIDEITRHENTGN